MRCGVDLGSKAYLHSNLAAPCNHRASLLLIIHAPCGLFTSDIAVITPYNELSVREF